MPRPRSPYGLHKLASEQALRYYGEAIGVRWTAFRFFNVYGPRQDPSSDYTGVISVFARRAAAGAPLVVHGDGEQTRDFVYVADVTRALSRACLTDACDGAVLNLGTGVEVSINALAARVRAVCRSRSEIRHAPPRAGDTRRSVAAIDKAAAALGFRAEVGLGDGLRQTLLAGAACAGPV